MDVAWAEIGYTRPIALSRDDVIAIGKDPVDAVQVPDSWGLSNETYFGRVDVFYQIHCLAALRREAYFEQYYGHKYPNGYNDTTEFHRLHLSHCIWLLLQNIMCSANTDVYTHIPTDTFERPFPDSSINHQCKNFESILEWQRKRGLDEESFVGLEGPEGYQFSVMSHKFKDIHGWFFTHVDDHDLTSGKIG